MTEPGTPENESLPTTDEPDPLAVEPDSPDLDPAGCLASGPIFFLLFQPDKKAANQKAIATARKCLLEIAGIIHAYIQKQSVSERHDLDTWTTAPRDQRSGTAS